MGGITMKKLNKKQYSVTVNGKNYWLRRTELILDANGPVYCWGICVEKGGEDTWGQS